MWWRSATQSDEYARLTAPFEIPAPTDKASAVLVVHGFTGSPFEMRLLGESLAARGHHVVGPRLAGHGSTAAELGATTWHDWYASVEHAFDRLRAAHDRVVVCGLSLGGLLTLELARRRKDEIAAIVVMAAPLWLPTWMMNGIRRAARSRLLRGRILPKLAGSDVRDREMKRRNPTGRGFPVAALESLLDVMDHAKSHAPEVDRPALVAHARQDHTAPYACSEWLASHLAGPVETLTLERSFHLITLDVERDQLFARVGQFVDKHLTT